MKNFVCVYASILLIYTALSFADYIYLHPKLAREFQTKYALRAGKEQYLHPALFETLNLPSTHETDFYSLDRYGNPLIITSTPFGDDFSELRKIAMAPSMLSPYDPPSVFARIFSSANRLSVCGDGILDAANSEKCEFVLNAKSKRSSYVATVPPPNYHLDWVSDKKSLRPVQRECLWAPGRLNACLNRASSGGVQKPSLPSHLFTHYCGDGIFDISPTSSLLDSLYNAWDEPNSVYRQFFTICGYMDEHALLPIYCNEGIKPWIVPGKTIRLTPNSLEQCDLGEVHNGATYSGCTSKCILRCSYQRGGRVDWNDWPRLACHQPCLDERWTGTYCDIPACIHGIPNPHDGGCYSCDPGWAGVTCNENICGNGNVAGWADETDQRPICACNPGWYGARCDKSYCAKWSEDGKCSTCIPGKMDPITYCIQDACIYGEKGTGADGACIQPCKVRFFEGKFCNETKCIEWDMESLDFENLKCNRCLPGYSLPYCQPHSEMGGYVRCSDPWLFGADCLQTRKKSSRSSECISGWTGPYCSLMQCARGFPNFTHPELQCIPGTCVPGWRGKWCEISNLVPIHDLSKHADWAMARAKTFQYYTNLTETSPMSMALKQWKTFATSIVYGKRPTALVALGSSKRHMDWQENMKDMARIYLSEKGNMWTLLKPDPSLYAIISSIKLELEVEF